MSAAPSWWGAADGKARMASTDDSSLLLMSTHPPAGWPCWLPGHMQVPGGPFWPRFNSTSAEERKKATGRSSSAENRLFPLKLEVKVGGEVLLAVSLPEGR